jgi:hypothetical protein
MLDSILNLAETGMLGEREAKVAIETQVCGLDSL